MIQKQHKRLETVFQSSYFRGNVLHMGNYVNINKVAEAKGLKSNRSLRIAIQKGKYIAREVKVNGGTSYEILYSSLEPEVQEILENEEIKSTALVPLNNTPQPSFISESAKLSALAKVDIINALENLRNKYPTKKEADSIFIDLYNSGQYLPQVYNFLGTISIGTIKHYLKLYKESGEDYRALIPNYKVAKQELFYIACGSVE